MDEQVLVRTDEPTLEVPERQEPPLRRRGPRGWVVFALATIGVAATLALMLTSGERPSAPVDAPQSVADERTLLQEEKRLLLQDQVSVPADEAAVLQAEKQILRSRGS